MKVDPLFDEWRAYQKMLEHDHMYHRALFGRLKLEIQQRFCDSLAILDLGCGDVSPIRPLLETLPVHRYFGIDQSETALSHAEARLSSLDIQYRLHTGDLHETLQSVNEGFDVVVASFSLHHLETARAKQQVLAACHRVLKPAGMVAIIDVFKTEGERRESYLSRWVDFAKKSYLSLDPEEVASLVEHVHANDFPEALSTYQSIGRAAGFDNFAVLMQDKEKFNHLVTLTTA